MTIPAWRIVNEIASVSDLWIADIERDSDLKDGLRLSVSQLGALTTNCARLFSIAIPADLFATPTYRTAEDFAHWLDQAIERDRWGELQRQRARGN